MEAVTLRGWGAPLAELGVDSHVCCWSKAMGDAAGTDYLVCVAKVRWSGMMIDGSHDAAGRDLVRVYWNTEKGGARLAVVLPENDRYRKVTGCAEHVENGWEMDRSSTETACFPSEATDRAMIRQMTRTVQREAQKIGLRWKLKRRSRVSWSSSARQMVRCDCALRDLCF